MLIVTRDLDPHSDLMVLHLERRGIRPVRLHAQRIGQPDQISVSYDAPGKCQWTLSTPEGRLTSEEVGSIFDKNTALSAHEAEFVEGEIRAAVMGMLRITDAFWDSHPDALRVAESKPYQLHVAQGLGFRIPRTLITNEPERFCDFYDACDERVIYKPLTQVPFGATEGKGLFTNRVRPEHLIDLDGIGPGPCTFQELIPKRVELRITAIGDRLFPVEIHSQDHDASRVDWRRGDPVALKHAPHQLPCDIEQKCIVLLRRLNLQFGAIDLILTPEGEYVFLEINPSGQFAWMESLTGLPLIETLADLLVENANLAAGRIDVGK